MISLSVDGLSNDKETETEIPFTVYELCSNRKDDM